MKAQLGYCTNVHPGRDLAETRRELDRHAHRVQQRFAPNSELPLGLWLSAHAAKELRAPGRLQGFKKWLATRGLRVFTLNGFPYGDFHQSTVKHAVYRPRWSEPARLEFTRELVRILDALLPDGETGTISTLPIAWRGEADEACLAESATALRLLARELQNREETSGRRITLCLEPEPGCVLQESRDVVDFFSRHFADAEGDRHRRYIQVCHDTCHASVMGEDPEAVLRNYANHQISVGKVQISSALSIDFDSLPDDERQSAWERLQTFVEDRYLHQTTWFQAGNRQFHDDLSIALSRATRASQAKGRWRVHFHVPLFLSTVGGLQTTQAETRRCLADLQRNHPDIRHFEVETYAWNVLPADLRPASLAEGICRELDWAARTLGRSGEQ